LLVTGKYFPAMAAPSCDLSHDRGFSFALTTHGPATGHRKRDSSRLNSFAVMAAASQAPLVASPSRDPRDGSMNPVARRSADSQTSAAKVLLPPIGPTTGSHCLARDVWAPPETSGTCPNDDILSLRAGLRCSVPRSFLDYPRRRYNCCDSPQTAIRNRGNHLRKPSGHSQGSRARNLRLPGSSCIISGNFYRILPAREAGGFSDVPRFDRGVESLQSGFVATRGEFGRGRLQPRIAGPESPDGRERSPTLRLSLDHPAAARFVRLHVAFVHSAMILGMGGRLVDRAVRVPAIRQSLEMNHFSVLSPRLALCNHCLHACWLLTDFFSQGA
jgi:hypothetical protein